MPVVLPRAPQPMGPRASARPPLARIAPQFRSLWQGLHIGFVFNDADAAVDVVTGRRYAWSGDDGATVPSPWGRVVDFNGNSSGTHFVIPDADIGVIPDQTTMFVVFRLDAAPVAGDQYIFEILSDEASSFTWTVNYRVGKDGTDANKLKQSIAYSNSTATSSSSDLVVGEWYRNHLIQAEDVSEFWFNGDLDNRVSSTLGSITDRSNNWNIGKREGFTNRNFEGPIAMVLLYKRRLSVPEIRLQAADPFGMFRAHTPVVAIAPAGNVAITVPVATLTIAANAPTVATPVAVTVPNAALTIASFAPTPVVNTPVTVPLAALTIASFAPSVATPTDITVPLAALTIAAFAPTVDVGSSADVTVPLAALLLTAYAVAVATTGAQRVATGTVGAHISRSATWSARIAGSPSVGARKASSDTWKEGE